METMTIRYEGQNFEVPKHDNVGMFNTCDCPGGGFCKAPLSTKDTIESRLLALTETCWTFDERRQIRQELEELGVSPAKMPTEPGRSNHAEKCTRCHQVFKGRDAIHTLVERKKKLYCPTCARR